MTQNVLFWRAREHYGQFQKRSEEQKFKVDGIQTQHSLLPAAEKMDVVQRMMRGFRCCMLSPSAASHRVAYVRYHNCIVPLRIARRVARPVRSSFSCRKYVDFTSHFAVLKRQGQSDRRRRRRTDATHGDDDDADNDGFVGRTKIGFETECEKCEEK